MAIENVSDASGTLKRTARTKILPGGTRARAEKPGETAEQVKKWQDNVLKRTGRASIVLPTQEFLDDYCARLKAYRKREEFRDRLERQYLAGELVKAKAPRASISAR